MCVFLRGCTRVFCQCMRVRVCVCARIGVYVCARTHLPSKCVNQVCACFVGACARVCACMGDSQLISSIHVNTSDVNNVCPWHSQVSKWVGDGQENNGILVVTTLPSGAWLEAAAEHRPADRSAYLVVFSDDARTEITGNTSIHHGRGPRLTRKSLCSPLRCSWITFYPKINSVA